MQDTPTTYTVTLPTGTGYSAAAQGGSSSPVTNGGSFSFTVTISGGYKKGSDFAVKANGTALTANGSGVYTISDITQNQTVIVEGVMQDTPAPDKPIDEMESPQTSDSSNPLLFALLALAAVCGVGATVYRNKRT